MFYMGKKIKTGHVLDKHVFLLFTDIVDMDTVDMDMVDVDMVDMNMDWLFTLNCFPSLEASLVLKV